MTSENITSHLADGDGQRVAGAKDDGGPAFPTLPDGGSTEGMTLRDYFAAKALAALVGYMDRPLVRKETLAAHSYEMADAMLAARKA